MNGLEKITGRIQTDAQCEMDALEREARTKADLLLAAGRERADALMAEGRQQNEALAASQKARLVSAANMESRQMVLQAKQSCIDAVFDQAKARLLALPAAEYTEFLAKWVANAAETGTEELIFSAGTRNEIGQQVADRANQLRPGAAFVLSNSFHATAFSVIFEKEFAVVERTEKINTRMRDFTAMLGLSDHMVTEGMAIPFNTDWTAVNSRLKDKIDYSKAYIDEVLRDGEK